MGDSDATCKNLFIPQLCQRNLLLNELFLKGLTYTNKLKQSILLEVYLSHILFILLLYQNVSSMKVVLFHSHELLACQTVPHLQKVTQNIK